MRRVLSTVVIALAITACGGEARPIFDSGGTGPAGTETTGAGPIVTTTVPAEIAAVERLIAAADAPADGPPPAVGTPDVALADAIRSELEAGGADLTGVEIWILPITGTDERMIVFTVEATAEQLNEEGATDFFGDLDEVAALEDVEDITRFTFHYYDSDDEGDFVLTMTVPLDEITSGEEADPEQAAIQLQRLP